MTEGPEKTVKKRTKADCQFKVGGEPGPGRPKGVKNRVSELRRDVLEALDRADPKGAVEYLRKRARDRPNAFLGLVGKLLPLHIEGEEKVSLHFPDLPDAGRALADAAVRRLLERTDPHEPDAH